MNCKKLDLDLTGCLEINRDARQDVFIGFEIQGLQIAPDYTLTLYDRYKEAVKTYVLIPDANNVLFWSAPEADFTNSLMFAEILPTVVTVENRISITMIIKSK